MTLLYRTPNVIIGAHEWHAIVRQRYGRCGVVFFWRPLSQKPLRWEPISNWPGPKPPSMGEAFAKYRPHMAVAMQSEQAREAAIAVQKVRVEISRREFLAA